MKTSLVQRDREIPRATCGDRDYLRLFDPAGVECQGPGGPRTCVGHTAKLSYICFAYALEKFGVIQVAAGQKVGYNQETRRVLRSADSCLAIH